MTDDADRIEYIRELERRLARLEKTNTVLIREAERRIASDSGAFDLFRAATVLEEKVRERTARLEEARAQLRDSLSLVRATLEATTDGILVVDRAGRMVDYNERLLEIWRVPRDQVRLGVEARKSTFVLDQLSDPQSYLRRTEELYDDPEAEGFDVLQLKDGRILERYSVPQRVGGEPVGRVWSFRDVTERRRSQERLRYLANYDELTGLPNRSHFRERLEQAMAHARRAGTRIAVLFMDLDRFKAVNDTLGHWMGDELLKGVADRVSGCLRAEDVFARQGGDEFTIVLGEVSYPEAAATVADKILQCFTAPFTVQSHTLHSSASIGITVYPDDAEDADSLMRNADTAMYLAKEKGRDTYQFFTPELDAAARERLTIEAGLRQAMDNDELRLVFQPQLDLRSGTVIGFEVLLRWEHPQLGTLLPDRFVPVAEETGLIIPIGEWVLHEACRQWREWRDRGFPPVSLSVNMSVRQLRQSGLAGTVAEVLGDSGMEARWLELELTESMLMTSADISSGVLEELKAVGVRLAVDDFGTGYSSLTYLKRFPLDTLKIDRAFIRDVEHDSDDAEIARGIIALGRALRLNVVAEGVENAAQRDFLLREGCYAAQGYFLAWPKPSDEAATHLRPVQPTGRRRKVSEGRR